ncbi:hypothetical protein ACH0C8_16065, partial [Acetobacter lovaniensis]|uniref:hypothetical protein n=1 Tax=Acetobacter lovaniensis TaxID=104100 RepID=UPI00376FA56C
IYFDHAETPEQILVQGALAVCILYQAWKIFPYTLLSSKAAQDSKKPEDNSCKIRLVVTNVLMTNRHYADCLNVLRMADPDVIMAVETNKA